MNFTRTNDSAVIGSAEYSIIGKTTEGVPLSNTTEGFYQFFVDLSELGPGDVYRLRVYEKCDPASKARLADDCIVVGPLSRSMVISPTFQLAEGWDFTVQKLSGVDRKIHWSIRRAY